MYSENDWGFLLYLAPGKFLCLPKRVMNADQVEELQALPKAADWKDRARAATLTRRHRLPQSCLREGPARPG